MNSRSGFLSNLKIGPKLILAFSVLSALCIIAVGAIGYYTAQSALHEVAVSRLTSIRVSKAENVEEYFATLRNLVSSLSESRMTVEALREL